ncbi:hypothetical protein [Autumnicola musiva]|uniref:Phosphopeptide-binding protein n=1 Tax=Autumnicola musiva TaxID=3075589 RepID=A0ABU3DAI1_9FLAO|nr:hypothetical protein [Zunongwangia sp. F117]MDT0678540.1 hypothetical protein [Zunongwangia sp. F117]
MKTILPISLLVLGITLTSCKNTDKENRQPETDNSIQETAVKDTIRLEKLTGSVSYPEASLTLQKPTGSSVNSKTIDFDFEVENYELGEQTDSPLASTLANSGKGQHIHLIVNNNPYSAHYEPEFSKELSEGTHHIVAFLSRSYHESVKNENSFVYKTIQIGSEKEDETRVDMEKPTLIYSRPKGEYSRSDTENLLLDFFLLNTELSKNGNKVKATINGIEFLIDEWAPYVIKGLPKGEVSIRLELIDKEGNKIKGAYNDVTRIVTLKE